MSECNLDGSNATPQSNIYQHYTFIIRGTTSKVESASRNRPTKASATMSLLGTLRKALRLPLHQEGITKRGYFISRHLLKLWGVGQPSVDS